MAHFRKIPVVIEAMRFTDGGGLPFADDGAEYDALDISNICPYKLKTLNGWVYLSYGEYIIKGVNGEFYPCAPDIFEATYEATQDHDIGDIYATYCPPSR